MSEHSETVLKDATLEEMVFWEKIYISIVSANDCKSSSAARSWATKAVLNRRETFPRLVEEERIASDV